MTHGSRPCTTRPAGRRLLRMLPGALIAACSLAWPSGPAAQRAAEGTANWTLHNLDLAGSRFSALDQINASNVKSLVPRWLFQYGIIDGVSNQTTPIVVDGIMYVTDPRGSVYAVDAADGHLIWTFDVTKLIGAGSCVTGGVG